MVNPFAILPAETTDMILDHFLWQEKFRLCQVHRSWSQAIISDPAFRSRLLLNGQFYPDDDVVSADLLHSAMSQTSDRLKHLSYGGELRLTPFTQRLAECTRLERLELRIHQGLEHHLCTVQNLTFLRLDKSIGNSAELTLKAAIAIAQSVSGLTTFACHVEVEPTSSEFSHQLYTSLPVKNRELSRMEKLYLDVHCAKEHQDNFNIASIFEDRGSCRFQALEVFRLRHLSDRYISRPLEDPSIAWPKTLKKLELILPTAGSRDLFIAAPSVTALKFHGCSYSQLAEYGDLPNLRALMLNLRMLDCHYIIIPLFPAVRGLRLPAVRELQILCMPQTPPYYQWSSRLDSLLDMTRDLRKLDIVLRADMTKRLPYIFNHLARTSPDLEFFSLGACLQEPVDVTQPFWSFLQSMQNLRRVHLYGAWQPYKYQLRELEARGIIFKRSRTKYPDKYRQRSLRDVRYYDDDHDCGLWDDFESNQSHD